MIVDILGSLQPHFPDLFDENDEQKLDELHSIFTNHFFSRPITCMGKSLQVKRYPYTNCRKDDLPQHFERFYEKFVHIVTRKPDKNGKNSKREFDIERANRIHWIKPILENCDDARITSFRSKESNGSIRNYFWYKAKKFMVILEEIVPNYVLITGYCVDDKNHSYYQRKYTNRIV